MVSSVIVASLQRVVIAGDPDLVNFYQQVSVSIENRPHWHLIVAIETRLRLGEYYEYFDAS